MALLTKHRRGQPHTSLNGILPVEILGQVFFEGCIDKQDTDFLLRASHVSKYWRDTALTTPYLWWDCYMSLGTNRPSSLERGRAWLERSRKTPVRICIRFYQTQYTIGDAMVPTDIVQETFHLAAIHVPHCRSLVLDNRGSRYLQYNIPVTLGKMFHNLGHNAPALKEYCFYGSGLFEEGAVDVLPDFIMPQFVGPLKRLRLVNDASTDLNPRMVVNMTSLQYRRETTWDRPGGEWIGTRRLTVSDVFQIITLSPGLVHLDISDIEMCRKIPPQSDLTEGDLKGEDPPFVLPNLEWLNLSFRSTQALGQFLGKTSFPAIRHLVLDVDNEDPDPPLTSSILRDSKFPNLRSVYLSSVPSHVICSVLRRAPNLHSLWLNDLDDWNIDRSYIAITRVIDFLTSGAPKLCCPLLKSVAFIECNGLNFTHLRRLITAYMPSEKHIASASCSGKFESLYAQLQEDPPRDAVEALEKWVNVVDLEADAWPDDHYADPFDFTRTEFHE